jgi:transcriptional regulator with XRE-family HTH domain
MDNASNTFIRDQLKAKGLTHQDLGEALNRVRVQATAIINGQQPLKLEQLKPTADLLGISIFDLMVGLGIDPGRPTIDAALLADSMIAVFKRLGIDTERVDQAASMVATIYEHAARDPGFRQPDGMTSLAGALSAFAQTVGRK